MAHTIEIFNIKGQDTVTTGAACNSCSGGCEPVTHDIRDSIKSFNENHSDLADIIRYELSEDNLDQVAERLQEVYQAAGEGLIITGSNVKFILSRLNPIIVINDQLVANNYVPDADELVYAVENNMKIYGGICQ